MQRITEAKWQRLWRDLALKGDSARWHERLVRAYSEPHRKYHNLEHLSEALVEWDSISAHAAQPLWGEAALWFHDAVYDPRSATNEEDSAALAEQCLRESGATAEVIEGVRRLILATKTHDAAGNFDAELLIDADLSILGKPAERFWRYENAIRAEYAWVPWATYSEKRYAILERFLRRPNIFSTAVLRKRYEQAARANLAQALERLKLPERRSSD